MTDIAERLRADPLRNFDEAAAEIERLSGFARWILDAYDNDEWPAQKDIVAGAREAIGND
jgi:hypothetical protein